MRTNNMLRVIVVCLMIAYISGNNQELHCSRYHYEEQVLAKLVRMEYRLEQLENKSNEKDPKCCPDRWVSFRGSCYLISENKLSFYEAVMLCGQLNAYLVNVESEIENTFLKSYLNGLKGENYWMGLTDTDKEGEFKWYDTDKLAMFTDWIGDQPDNYGGGENCAHFNSEHGYKWNDNPCNYKTKAICEKMKM